MIEFEMNKDWNAKNTWRPTRETDGSISPVITDSGGDMFGIAAHTISEDGVVSPSVVCPYDNDCTFHAFIKLKGWDEIKVAKHP